MNISSAPFQIIQQGLKTVHFIEGVNLKKVPIYYKS